MSAHALTTPNLFPALVPVYSSARAPRTYVPCASACVLSAAEGQAVAARQRLGLLPLHFLRSSDVQATCCMLRRTARPPRCTRVRAQSLRAYIPCAAILRRHLAPLVPDFGPIPSNHGPKSSRQAARTSVSRQLCACAPPPPAAPALREASSPPPLPPRPRHPSPVDVTSAIFHAVTTERSPGRYAACALRKCPTRLLTVRFSPNFLEACSID